MLSPDKLYDKDRIIKRLHAKSIVQDNHWLWIGKLRHERGIIVIGGKHGKDIEVHRLSASLFLGLDLKNGNTHALHKLTCPYKNCWNPDCLYVGSHQDNMRDYRQSNTHCPAGHSFSSYSGRKRNGDKYCRECHRLRTREVRADKKLTRNQ